MIETYRGYVNTWECDDVGHMNVQFYLSKLDNALEQLRHSLGHGPARAAQSGIALRPQWDHVHFLREVHVSTTLAIQCGVLEADDQGITVYSELQDCVSNSVSAAMTTRLDAVSRQDWSTAPLPATVQTAAQGLRVALPDYAAPKSVSDTRALEGLSLDIVRARGFFPIHHGVIHPADCNAHGWMLQGRYTARISDGAAHIWNAAGMDRQYLAERGYGVAVVESRQHYIRPVAAGTLVSIYSGVRGVSKRTASFAHMIFDTESGEPLARSEVTALLLDMSARRAGEFQPQERDRLEAARQRHGL